MFTFFGHISFRWVTPVTVPVFGKKFTDGCSIWYNFKKVVRYFADTRYRYGFIYHAVVRYVCCEYFAYTYPLHNRTEDVSRHFPAPLKCSYHLSNCFKWPHFEIRRQMLLKESSPSHFSQVEWRCCVYLIILINPNCGILLSAWRCWILLCFVYWVDTKWHFIKPAIS